MLPQGLKTTLSVAHLGAAVGMVISLSLASACVDEVQPISALSAEVAGSPSSIEPSPSMGNVVVGRSEGGGYVLRSRPSVPMDSAVSDAQSLELQPAQGVDP